MPIVPLAPKAPLTALLAQTVRARSFPCREIQPWSCGSGTLDCRPSTSSRRRRAGLSTTGSRSRTMRVGSTRTMPAMRCGTAGLMKACSGCASGWPTPADWRNSSDHRVSCCSTAVLPMSCSSVLHRGGTELAGGVYPCCGSCRFATGSASSDGPPQMHDTRIRRAKSAYSLAFSCISAFAFLTVGEKVIRLKKSHDGYRRMALEIDAIDSSLALFSRVTLS